MLELQLEMKWGLGHGIQILVSGILRYIEQILVSEDPVLLEPTGEDYSDLTHSLKAGATKRKRTE